jgi:hypothetical protein
MEWELFVRLLLPTLLPVLSVVADVFVFYCCGN